MNRRLLIVSLVAMLAMPSCADDRPTDDATATTSTAPATPVTTPPTAARCPAAASVQRFEPSAAELPTAALAFEQRDGDTAMCLYRRSVTPRAVAPAGS